MKTNKRFNKQARFFIEYNDINNSSSLSLTTKREERKVKLKRRSMIIRSIIIIILIIAVIWTTLLFLDKKGVIGIEKISVKGNKYYDDATIIDSAKIKKGLGLLSADGNKIKKSIKDLSYVKSVNISKKFPHTLVISIVEKAPEYAIYTGGYYICLDKELNILNKSNEANGLKVVEGFTPENAKEGTKFTTKDMENFNKAIKLSNIVEKYNLNIYKISHRNSFMRIFFSKNMVCEGTYDNLVNNVTKLNDILDSLNKRGIERATIYIGDNDYVSFSPRIE